MLSWGEAAAHGVETSPHYEHGLENIPRMVEDWLGN
jgi:hypothetical protein